MEARLIPQDLARIRVMVGKRQRSRSDMVSSDAGDTEALN